MRRLAATHSLVICVEEIRPPPDADRVLIYLIVLNKPVSVPAGHLQVCLTRWFIEAVQRLVLPQRCSNATARTQTKSNQQNARVQPAAHNCLLDKPAIVVNAIRLVSNPTLHSPPSARRVRPRRAGQLYHSRVAADRPTLR